MLCLIISQFLICFLSFPQSAYRVSLCSWNCSYSACRAVRFGSFFMPTFWSAFAAASRGIIAHSRFAQYMSLFLAWRYASQADFVFWQVITFFSSIAISARHFSDAFKLQAVFYTAIQDDYIRKNPFGFQINTVIEDDTEPNVPLSPLQEASFLSFIADDKVYRKHYDEIIILLGIGLRISELADRPTKILILRIS